MSPVGAELPLTVYRDGEEVGSIHSIDGRLIAESPKASEQTKIQGLIRRAELDEGGPLGEHWSRLVDLLQVEGYLVAGTGVHDPEVASESDDIDYL